MKKIKPIHLLLVLTLLLTTLCACGHSPGREPSSSGDRANVHVGLIMGPPSMGLGWFMNQVEQGNTYHNYQFTVDGTDYSKLAASLNDGTYDLITCPSNIAAILANNEDLKTSVKVISINNTGLLYILTTDPSISSLSDLKGKNLYAIGEGGTPEYTLQYVLRKTHMEKEVNLSFKSTPFEVLNFLEKEPNSVAMLPQPFVEVAKTMVPGLKVPIDLTEEWGKVEKKAEAITAVTVVREDFLADHEEAVLEYLSMSRQSTDYTNSHVEQAAKWTEDYDTFLNPEIAKTALPKCNIVTITGESMKEKVSGFLQILLELDPASVGGSLPKDSFYYLPPEGSDLR